MMLAQSALKDALSYDPNTGVFVWKKTRGGKKAGTVAGCRNDQGYWLVGIAGRLVLAHRLAWFYMTGEWPSDAIDHKNGERSDNRWSNLRPATWADNSQNRKLPNTNTSGYPGVSFHKASNAWRAQIQADGKKRHLGLFRTAEEAHAAHSAAKKKFHTFQPVPRYEEQAA